MLKSPNISICWKCGHGTSTNMYSVNNTKIIHWILLLLEVKNTGVVISMDMDKS